MRIQHNITAMNSYRNLGINNSNVASNLEKLSSGYKINRAGDDAAGLAISEKMRAQITGLETAQKNANDGISLVQTAEGALTEVHSMLNRMVELATQSANGTYATEDRANLQAEINALNEEVNRIAETTNFNGINLLDGSISGSTITANGSITTSIGAVGTTLGTNTFLGKEAVTATKTSFSIDLEGAQAAVDTADETFTISIGTGNTMTATLAVGNYGAEALAAELVGDLTTAGELEIGGVDYVVSVDATDASKINFVMKDLPTAATTEAELNGNFNITVGGTSETTGTLVNAATQNIVHGAKPDAGLGNTVFSLTSNHIVDGATLTIGKQTFTFKVGPDSTVDGENVIDLSDKLSTDSDLIETAVNRLTVAATTNDDFTVGQGTTAGTVTLQQKSTSTLDLTTLVKFQAQVSANSNTVSDDLSLSLQVGDTAEASQKVSVAVKDMSAKALGIDGIDITTEAGADAAISKIKAAITAVSAQRGDLGAIQNRLDHTINNLGVTTENLTAAESRIRDVDMAEEMMAYTKNNILVQASQAMLAQANQIPQGVLQLLQ